MVYPTGFGRGSQQLKLRLRLAFAGDPGIGLAAALTSLRLSVAGPSLETCGPNPPDLYAKQKDGKSHLSVLVYPTGFGRRSQQLKLRLRLAFAGDPGIGLAAALTSLRSSVAGPSLETCGPNPFNHMHKKTDDTRPSVFLWCIRQDSNLRPQESESCALSNWATDT